MTRLSKRMLLSSQRNQLFKIQNAGLTHHKGYRWFDPTIPHCMVQHGDEEYVCGAIHTNTIEGFWFIVKRVIVGKFRNVSKEYLHPYVNKFECCYNQRMNAQVFGAAIKAC